MSCTQVKRSTVLDVDAERAWDAISRPDELERWLADEVDLDLVEGSPARFNVDGEERPARVERVEEGRALSFTWERDGRASLVELELTDAVSGTRIDVTETDLGAGPTLSASSWTRPMSRLRGLAALALA